MELVKWAYIGSQQLSCWEDASMKIISNMRRQIKQKKNEKKRKVLTAEYDALTCKLLCSSFEAPSINCHSW